MTGSVGVHSSCAVADAHRLVHCCYVTDNADEAVSFLADGLGLSTTLVGGISPFDAGAFGDFGVVEAYLSLVFDPRGPRVGPSIEVQGCITPAAVGAPYATITNPGLHAIGLAMRDVNGAVARAIEHGAHVVADHSGLAPALGVEEATVIRDSRGVAFDLVPQVDPDGSNPQIRHYRISCPDLELSRAWYRRIGFVDVAPATEHSCHGPISTSGGPKVLVGRLRLPDNPCELILHQWPIAAEGGRTYPGPSHRGLYRLAVAVDDLDESISRLQADGVTFRRAPELLTLTGTKVPPMRTAFLCDPDGIPVEMLESHRSAYK